jgi:hypothetical protein
MNHYLDKLTHVPYACLYCFVPAGSHPRWTQELAQLSPSSLVQLLTASESRLLRLAYLADQGKQAKAPLYASMVNFPEARWLGKYPGYTAWAAAHKQRLQ